MFDMHSHRAVRMHSVYSPSGVPALAQEARLRVAPMAGREGASLSDRMQSSPFQ